MSDQSLEQESQDSDEKDLEDSRDEKSPRVQSITSAPTSPDKAETTVPWKGLLEDTLSPDPSRSRHIDVEEGAAVDRQPSSNTDHLTAEQRERRMFQTYYKWEDLVSETILSEKFSLPEGQQRQKCLVLNHSFGYDSLRRRNLQVLSKDTVAFVAGAYIRVYELSSKRNVYIRSTGGGPISSLAVHPSKACFAAGEKGLNPVVNIFGFPSLRLRKRLLQGTKKDYVSVEFEPVTGELLATQGGEPDFFLTIWNWAAETPLLNCKSFSQDVYRVLFNPELQGFLVTTGLAHIRFWRMATTFTGLKLKGLTGRFGGRNPTNIEACIMFADGKVVSGSEDGRMLLWEEALLKAEFCRLQTGNCHRGQIYQMFMYEGEIATMGQDGYIRTWSADSVLFVEPAHDGEMFHLTVMMEICVHHQALLMYMQSLGDKKADEDCWLVQDRNGSVWSVDMGAHSVHTKGKLKLQFHGGKVNACAVSPISHLVATVGQDGVFRIFDCLAKEELLSMTFSAGAASLLWLPQCVDPLGASVIIGFDDGVIRKVAFQVKDLPEWTDGSQPRDCGLQGKLVQAFKAHRARVTSLALSCDGELLVSGGSDSTIFLFHVEQGDFHHVGWLPTPAPVTQLLWSPIDRLQQDLLIVCEKQVVLELPLFSLQDAVFTSNFQITSCGFRVYKFLSVRSLYEHELEVQLEEAEEERLQQELAAQALKDAEASAADPAQEERSSRLDRSRSRNTTVAGGPNLWVEEEKVWQPHLPDPPCRVLCAAYSSTDQRFWLTVDGYDRAYVYLCDFPEELYNPQDLQTLCLGPEHSPRPSLIIPVPDHKDASINFLQMCVDGFGLMGFSDGRVRVLQLDAEAELQNMSAYMELGVHDDKSGGISCVARAFDNSFIITTGHDGNIFLFSYCEGLEQFQNTRASLPRSYEHHHTCKDLAKDTLWFADQRDKEILENERQMAEVAKSKKRDRIKQLLGDHKQLLLQNEQLPARVRLPRHETLVKLDLYEEQQARRGRERAELLTRTAWATEKARLLLDKLQKGLMRHEKLPANFTLTAFCTSVKVRSYRVPGTLGTLWTSCKDDKSRASLSGERHSELRTGEATGLAPDLSDDQMWLAAFNLTQLHSSGFKGSVSRSLNLALERARRVRERRLKRKEEWIAMYEEKERIDMDDPEDVERIQEARRTVGDLKLRTDLSMAELLASEHTQSRAMLEMSQLDADCRQQMQKFNERLDQTRHIKMVLILFYRALDAKLQTMSEGQTQLSHLPVFGVEEVPETLLAFNEETLMGMLDKLHLTRDGEPVEVPAHNATKTERALIEAANRVFLPLYGHLFYIGERVTEFPEIVRTCQNKGGHKEVTAVHSEIKHDKSQSSRSSQSMITKPPLSRQQSPHTRQVLVRQQSLQASSLLNVLSRPVSNQNSRRITPLEPMVSDQNLFAGRLGEIEEDVLCSEPLRKDISRYARLQIQHTLTLYTDIVKQLQDCFDEKLVDLSKQQLELDVYLKRCDLRSVELLEEIVIARRMGQEELSMRRDEDKAQNEYERNTKSVISLKRRLDRQKDANDSLNETLKELMQKFQNATRELEENRKMMHYLVMLYRRRASKKKVRDAEQSAEEESDSESSDDFDLASSSSEEGSEMGWSLDYCPQGLKEEIFQAVVALQKQRQEADASLVVVKQDLQTNGKELEQKMKETEPLRRVLERARENLIKFYQFKMATINDIMTVVVLQQERMLVQQEEGLVVDRRVLRRLMARLDEIRDDIKNEAKVMKSHSKTHYLLRRANRLLSEKVQSKSALCDEEIVKKFGRLVNINHLELITINPEVEILGWRLLQDRKQYATEVKDQQRQIRDLRYSTVNMLSLNSKLTFFKAGLTNEKIRLEKRLNKKVNKIPPNKLLSPSAELEDSRGPGCLNRVICKQKEVIANCLGTIHFLRHIGMGEGKTYRHHLRDPMQAHCNFLARQCAPPPMPGPNNEPLADSRSGPHTHPLAHSCSGELQQEPQTLDLCTQDPEVNRVEVSLPHKDTNVSATQWPSLEGINSDVSFNLHPQATTGESSSFSTCFGTMTASSNSDQQLSTRKEGAAGVCDPGHRYESCTPLVPDTEQSEKTSHGKRSAPRQLSPLMSRHGVAARPKRKSKHVVLPLPMSTAGQNASERMLQAPATMVPQPPLGQPASTAFRRRRSAVLSGQHSRPHASHQSSSSSSLQSLSGGPDACRPAHGLPPLKYEPLWKTKTNAVIFQDPSAPSTTERQRRGQSSLSKECDQSQAEEYEADSEQDKEYESDSATDVSGPL